MSTKAKEAPKSLDDLARLAADQAEEIEIAEPSADEELTFEGGELDGKHMTVRDLRKLDAGESATAVTEEETEGKVDEKQPDPAAAAAPDAIVTEKPDGDTTPPAEAAPGSEEGAKAEPEYKPDFRIVSYGKESQFPEWAQKVCTSKEVEDNLRAAIQKSESFDTLKTKHETIVQELGHTRGLVDESVQKTQNMVRMRDTNLHLFLRNMGVNDDAVLRLGIDLAKAQDDPAAAERLTNQLTQGQQSFDQAQADANARAANANLWTQTVTFEFGRPEVQDFRQRLEGVYGPGSFEKAFELTGSSAYQRGEGNLHPAVVVQRVMEHYGKMLPGSAHPSLPPPPGTAPAPQAATAQQSQAQPRPAAHGVQPAAPASVPPQRPKTLQTVGRGTSVSPTARKLRSLDDVKARVDAELGR